jgi:hypothetical protein
MCLLMICSLSAQEKPRVKTSKSAAYCRFQVGPTIAYGIVEGDKVRQLDGNLFESPKPSQKTYPLDEVTLLVPTEPKNVFAMADYRPSADNITTTKNTVTKLRPTENREDDVRQQNNTDTQSSGSVPTKFKLCSRF